MSVLQSIDLSPDAIKMRYKEPYVTAGLNQKNIANYPKGVIAGFDVVPSSGFVVKLQLDPFLNLSVANIIDTAGIYYSISIIQTADLFVDLTAQANSTVFIALDAQYVIGSPTTAQVKVVNAAELLINADLTLLARVEVPNVGPVTTAHINAAYRTNAGDSILAPAKPSFNLVNNAGFETDAAAGPASGWTLTGGITAVVSTTFAHSGTKSLKITNGTPAACSVLTPMMPVVPGEVYRAGIWFRTDPSGTFGTGFQLKVTFYDAVLTPIGASLLVDDVVSSVQASFVERKGMVTAPALAVQAKLEVACDVGTTIPGYIDDVQFSTSKPDAVMHSVLFGGPNSEADQYHTHTTSGGYGGGINWYDGTTNPATTVENQLDKILIDLAGSSPTAGAPKIKNAASLIVANVFTQLNTFNLGVAIASTQPVGWPNWFLTQLTPTTFKIDATDPSFVSRQFNFLGQTTGGPPNMKFEMIDVAFGTSFKIESGNFTFATHRIGTEDDAQIRIRINATDTWLFTGSFSAYDLVAPTGGNVTNLRAPTGYTEAARVNYVNSVARMNFTNVIINGDFRIWQRDTSPGVGPDTELSVASNTRAYLPDRWYLHSGTGGGAGARLISRQTISGSPPSNFKYACRVRRPTSSSSTNIADLAQEIDREFLRRLATPENFASEIIFRFWLRVGTGFSGFSGGILEIGTISGVISPTESQWYGIYGGGNATSLAVVTPTTTWTQYTVTGRDFSNAKAAAFVVRFTPTGGPATSEDWFEITGVEAIPVVFGTNTELAVQTFPFYLPYRLAGGDPAGEVELCQRYFEKSFNLDTPPGTVTPSGQERMTAGSTGSGHTWSPGVRYKTRKHPYAPSYTNWFTYDPTTGNGGPTFGNVGYNFTGPSADFGLDSANEGGETGFNIDVDSTPVAGDVVKFHWRSDCDI